MPLSREPRARGIYTDEVDQKGGYLAKVRDKEARAAAKAAADTAKADLEKYSSEANARLDDADSRLDGAEDRLDGAEDRLDGAEDRLDGAEDRLDGIDDQLDNILNVIYPVGSIYMSVNAASPATLFGGTWERIKDTFLLSAGDAYAAGATGGEAAHTLSVAETPRHNHATFIFNANNTSFDAYRADGSGGWYRITYGGRLPGGHLPWQTAAFKTAGSNYSGIGTGDFAGNTDIVGGGGAHNNMPPYLAVYVWKRIA